MPAPLLVKFRVHVRSHIKLTLVAVETPVEHTITVGKCDEADWYGIHTSHPITVTVRETVVKAVLNTEHDDGDYIDRIYET